MEHPFCAFVYKLLAFVIFDHVFEKNGSKSAYVLEKHYEKFSDAA